MKIFQVHILCNVLRGSLRSTSLLEDREQHPEIDYSIPAIKKKIEELKECCQNAALPMSVLAINRVLSIFSLSPTSLSEVLYDEVTRAIVTIEDETSLRTYFSLDDKQAINFLQLLNGWSVIISRFPKTRQNIEESSKCFAFERYGAAVFHVLLVAEYGVIQIAKLLNVAGDRPGWGQLESLQRILRKKDCERSHLERQHSKILEDTVPLAVVVKDSWRNHSCPRQRFCRRRAVDFKGHTHLFPLTAAGLSGIPSAMDF